MLVDNKFLYISLPRCGSTSFHYSCILNGMSVNNISPDMDAHNNSIDFSKVNELEIMNVISHGHEPINELRKKFGYDLPVISVHRDRHEAFLSLYKHIIYDTNRTGSQAFSNWFANIDLDELFFYETKDLMNVDSRWDVVNKFLIKNGFIKNYIDVPNTPTLSFNKDNVDITLIGILDVLIAPKSVWHNNDKNIIWFDINNLSEMEKWVSNITGKNFKLKHVNSHSDIKIKLELNDEFKNRYNSIYDYYDLPKNTKTLI